MATRLARRYEYDGLEPDRRSWEVASARLRALGKGRVLHLPSGDFAPEHRYDLVCAFEVLEHIEDDRGELKRWCQFLKAGGWVLLSVPAHRQRYGPMDRMVGHYRRYSRKDIAALLESADIELIRTEIWGVGLGHALECFRLQLALREGQDMPTATHQMMSRTHASGRWLQPHGPLAGLAAAIAALPFRLLQHPFRFTEFGIGWVVLGRLSKRGPRHHR